MPGQTLASPGKFREYISEQIWIKPLFDWPYDPAWTMLVQGRGYWINIVSLALTIAGFVATWVQIARAKRATALLREEVSRIHIAVTKYDATHEASKAESALNYARAHLARSEWINVADNYEDFLSAIHAIKELKISEISPFTQQLASAHQYGVKLCERIGNSSVGLGPSDVVKITSTMRAHSQLIASVRIALQRSAFS